MVIRIDRIPCSIAARHHSTAFRTALGSIVVRLTQTLDVRGVEKQDLIAIVLLYVVCNRGEICGRSAGSFILQAEGAHRFPLKLGEPQR